MSEPTPIAWATLLPSGKLHSSRNTKESADRRTSNWNARFPRPPHAVTVPLFRSSVTGPDTLRMEWLEDSAVDGVVTIGLEVDGGVHVTFDELGTGTRAVRHQNTVREGLDAIMPSRRKPLPAGVTPGQPVNAQGNYYAADGTFMNADGTRSIFDDVDE